MKKLLSFLLLVAALLLTGLVNVQTVNSIENWDYRETIIDGEDEYVLIYRPTGRVDYSFEPYTGIMVKPKTGKTTGEVTIYSHVTHIISGTLEVSSDVGALFSKVGFKITIGASYEKSRSLTVKYFWEYESTHYGDYAIFGEKRIATEYEYKIYRIVKETKPGSTGKNEKNTDVTTTEVLVGSGTFWQHNKIGEVGLYAFPASKYNDVLIDLNKGKFSQHLKHANSSSSGGSGGGSGGGGGAFPPFYDLIY